MRICAAPAPGTVGVEEEEVGVRVEPRRGWTRPTAQPAASRAEVANAAFSVLRSPLGNTIAATIPPLPAFLPRSLLLGSNLLAEREADSGQALLRLQRRRGSLPDVHEQSCSHR